jgi:hypothetical protein
MKFSIECLEKIEKVRVAVLGQQLGTEEIREEEMEPALRNSLQEVGRKSYGKMLSMLDQQQHGMQMEMKTLLWEGQIEVSIREGRSLLNQVGQPAQRLISESVE